MSDTFKATKYRKESQSRDKNVFKATKYRALDTTQLTSEANEAFEIMSDYDNRIANGEWLDEKDRAAYRSSIDTYVDRVNRIRDGEKEYGAVFSEEEETAWSDYVANLNSEFDNVSKMFSSYPNQTEYGAAFEKSAASAVPPPS